MSTAFVDSNMKGIRDLVSAIGLDPDTYIRSVTIKAECGQPMKAVIEQFVTVEQLGRVTEIVRRQEIAARTEQDREWDAFVDSVVAQG